MDQDRRSLQIADHIKWPKGKRPDKLKKQVSKLAGTLLTGTVLAIDPASGASSPPGWALFRQGHLVEYGVVTVNPRNNVQQRLSQLHNELMQAHPDIDILIMEEIRGSMAHVYLHWACGVIASSFPSADLIELPISFWKAVIPDGYVKADDTDAAYIGLAAILLARDTNG